MKKYKGANNNSGVESYEIGDDYIKIKFVGSERILERHWQRVKRRMRNRCHRGCLRQFNIDDLLRSGLWLGRYFCGKT